MQQIEKKNKIATTATDLVSSECIPDQHFAVLTNTRAPIAHDIAIRFQQTIH